MYRHRAKRRCSCMWFSAKVTRVERSRDDGSMAALLEGQTRTVAAMPRVLSIDVLRGVTIALMILVNDPGDWSHVFSQLDHAPWNGWTLTDLVFPTFLFLVGAAMLFSLEAREARGNCKKTLAGHLFARAGKIFLLDLVLGYFPRMHWGGLRLYGVLTRIAQRLRDRHDRQVQCRGHFLESGHRL